MSLDADALVDRRRLRRKLGFWRVVAFIAVIIGLLAVALQFAGDPLALARGPHVARVTIDGFIGDDRDQQELLRKIAKDSQVKALILSINSPGGTTTGAEALYEAVREVAEEKPVVATLGTIAASGGYIAAISADHIVARGNTITGSIGVIFQWAQVKDLLANWGIRFDEIKSSPIKAEPDPFTDTPEEARQILEAMVADSYDWFVGLVAERRKLGDAEARRLGDGRVYTGRQALQAKLIDAIGGEDVARDWLADEHNISRDLKVHEWRNGGVDGDLSLVRSFANWVGLGAIFDYVGKQIAGGAAVRLDGLMSVWQAPTQKTD